jgi:hypothetical protein
MNRTILAAVTALAYAAALTGVVAEAPASRPYRFSGGISIDYTDNRDSVDTGKTDCFDFTMWVGAYLHLEHETSYSLTLGYSPSVRYRTDVSPFQNTTEVYHDLKLDGWYRPSRIVRLHLTEAFNRTDDPAVDSGGGTVRRDASFIINRAGAGVEADLSRRLRADLSGYSMIKRYSDGVFATSGDEDSTMGTASIAWIPDRMSALALYGSYGTFGYPGDSAGRDRGFDSVEAGLSYQRMLSKKFFAKADLAVKTLDYNTSALGSDQSPSGRLALNFTASSRLRFTGAGGYVLRDSDLQYFASQRYTDLSLRGEWDALVPKRLTVGVAGGYRIGDYRSGSFLDAYRTADSVTAGKEKTAILSADLTYRLKERFSVSAVAQYEDVSTDLSTPFDRMSAGIRTRVDF